MKLKLLKKLMIISLIITLLFGNIVFTISSVIANEFNDDTGGILNIVNNIMKLNSNNVSAEGETSEDIVKTAMELIGKPYKLGCKGYKGDLYEKEYIEEKLCKVEEIGNSELPTTVGIDCSGLVFWTLAKLGYKTDGFFRDNPVPVDTDHWLVPKGDTHAWKEAGGSKSYNENKPTISLNDSDPKPVEALKQNDDITADLRYYQYKDGEETKDLPMGMVIIAHNKEQDKAYNHAWITLGNLGTNDPNQVLEILKNMGISDNAKAKLEEKDGSGNYKYIRQTGGDCTYWRIESNGYGVNVNNGNPDSGAEEISGNVTKKIGPIWAFKIADEAEYEGNYGIKIKKVDENNQPLSGVSFKVEAEINGTQDNTLADNKLTNDEGIISLKDIIQITKDNYEKVDTYTIKEINLGTDKWIKRNEEIKVNVKKLFNAQTKEYTVEAKFDDNSISKEFTLEDGTKVTATVNIQNNIVTITIPNKNVGNGSYGIKIRKVDENNQPLSGVSFKVEAEINGTQDNTLADNKLTNDEGIISLKDIIQITKDNYEKVDTYTIKEINLGTDKWIKRNEEIKVNVKKLFNAQTKEYTVEAKFDDNSISKEFTLEDGTKVTATVNIQNNIVTITIPNKTKKEGNYVLNIKKVTANGNEIVGGVKFKYSKYVDDILEKEDIETKETDSKTGLTEIETVKITNDNVNKVDSYKITEVDVGSNSLIKIVDPVTIYIRKELKGDKYEIVDASFSKEQNGVKELENVKLVNGETTKVTLEVTNNVVTIIIPNAKKTGEYKVNLVKVDTAGNVINDTFKFVVNENEIETTEGILNIAEGKSITEDGQIDTYEITEKEAPKKYGLYKNTIKLNVVGKESDNGFEVNGETTNLIIGEESIEKGEKSSDGYVTWDISGDTITITLENRQFDLALYKWVTTTLVTEDGKTSEYSSEHTQSDKSNVVNVSIPKNKLNDVVVKFKYTIRVENQGELDGYAKEIKDHIPDGLKFVPEDNVEFGWKAEDDNTITTDYLKDTLLKHGETAEVTVVLTWINGSNNFGQKVNFAEISEDYNDYNDSDDIDSTPDNFTGEVVEDDEDSDVVMLQIKTGEVVNSAYCFVAIAFVGIVAVGAIGVKKFVL